ncbi:helix-turn-helix domain-containing protein [Clostridium beijerinckii]|uniref:helix-turn-helix domain-containing protein n=1 Tax=Clostridium beijerinckii TaxID=1520 RepID=UPI00047E6D78|nr:helix-turn-helix domain-containing protein [Clostridium beijerinckii]
MGATKDFIKFRQYIRTQDLKVNEQYLLELFFEYHNTQYGYCFLTYEQIMQSFNTTSKNRISKSIKNLQKLGLINIDKRYSNNRYYIVNVESFIVENKSKDSSFKVPMTEQVEFKLSDEEKEAINSTNFSRNQVKTLLQLSKNKMDKVIAMIKYVSNKANIANKFGYIKALLERGVNIDDTKQNYHKKHIPFIDNCSSRNYDESFYKNLEEKLLGWR